MDVFMVVLMDVSMEEHSRIELFHLFLGLKETRLQGVEASF
jgi:hypothetical protein